jgi:hypothetical protein
MSSQPGSSWPERDTARSPAERTLAIAEAIVHEAGQLSSVPLPLAIEGPRATLDDLRELAAEHGYDLTRRED